MDDDQQPLGNSPGPDGRGRLHVNPIGSGLMGVDYDNGVATYPDDVTEVYTFKKVAATVCTITLVYVDATKKRLSTWNIVKP